MQEDMWAGGEEISLPAGDKGWNGGKVVDDPLPPKECEGKNCIETFNPTYWKQRRCPKCRKNKTPYRESDAPF